MTAKKTADRAENPFSTETGLKLDDKVEPKTTNEVVETDETKAGTAQDKPVEPTPVEDDKPKATRKRRTKAEIEADKAKDSEPEEREGSVFDELDFEKLPLSSQSGNIVGSVDLNQGSVPTLNISIQNWIGAPIIAIAASQIGDVETVLNDLKKQAKKIKL